MKRFWLLGLLPLLGFSRVTTVHDSTSKVDREFTNIEESLQDQQFTVIPTTPNLRALKDGQFVIVSSGNFIMFRNGDDIFKINTSCVTVTR